MLTKLDKQILDHILKRQFQVAWAGEGLCDPKRLGWWRTDLVDENSGGDLLARLAPRTHRWAALRAVREAASLIDQQARAGLANPDRLRTLFHWGFEIDEQLEDRLRECTLQRDKAPEFGSHQELVDEWSRLSSPKFETQTVGREIKGPMSSDLTVVADQLVAALVPVAAKYSLPYFIVSAV